MRAFQSTLCARTKNDALDGPPTILLRVLDGVDVRFGPGLEVQKVVTGFESRVLFLKNVPSCTPTSLIREALLPFGEVLNIYTPRTRVEEGTMTVKAAFENHTAASAAARALDGCTLFSACLTAFLASEKSTALGKGVVRDGDVLLEFPAPSRDAFVGYSTLEGARHATQVAYRAQMGDSILAASIYRGLPAIGLHNVRFYGLPPDTKPHELEAFGSNTGVMFTRPTYASLDAALLALQTKLEKYGELTSITVPSPPYENKKIRAWARFTTPTAAANACEDLNGRRPWFFGHGRLTARHVLSIIYHLPNRLFDALSDTLQDLCSLSERTTNCYYMTFHSRDRERTGSVGVKLIAETYPSLTKLKTSLESILRGEVVRLEGRAAWDYFFTRASGAAFVASLEANHPPAIIQVDTRQSCIRLFGPPPQTWHVKAVIQAQIRELRTRKVHSIFLNSAFPGILTNPNFLALQRDLGAQNVYIDRQRGLLKVCGNQDEVQVAHLVVQSVRRQYASRELSVNNCRICLGAASLPITLDCGHTSCKNCLTDYFLSAIDTKSFPLLCVGLGCKQLVPVNIIRRLLPPENFHHLTHASFLDFIHSRPTEFNYCPTPDCPQVYRTAPPGTVVQCPSCLVRICGSCHSEAHEGKGCPDPEKNELRLFEEWSAERDVKRCPGCKTFIERDAGCNHITCTRCRTHICWVCLETFSEGAKCYDHMRMLHGGIGL